MTVPLARFLSATRSPLRHRREQYNPNSKPQLLYRADLDPLLPTHNGRIHKTRRRPRWQHLQKDLHKETVLPRRRRRQRAARKQEDQIRRRRRGIGTSGPGAEDG